ncbi:MAG: DUF3552 domain-containing protein, partial [Clostridia bacterium]|nr:DUF3552 domain-containing protein [Clostridia bacterium]
MPSQFVPYLIGAAVAVLLGIIGFVLGTTFRKKSAEKAIGSAEDEAKRILNDALKTAETRKKEALIEAKDEIHQLRQETEKDLRERRSEVQRQEHRLLQREETLDKKTDNLEAKEEKLAERAKEIDSKIEECETLKKSQMEMLEKISGYSKEQAKAYLLEILDGELVHEKAVRINEFQQTTTDEASNLAREIIGRAIQRCAADHSSEMTVSVVALPN